MTADEIIKKVKALRKTACSVTIARAEGEAEGYADACFEIIDRLEDKLQFEDATFFELELKKLKEAGLIEDKKG